MSDEENDSNDWESEDEYIFEILPLTNSISELKSLEYLQNYILQVELDMSKHIENEFKYGDSIDKHNYDWVISFISLNKNGHSHQIKLFETIYENTIFGFKFHLNEELLLYGLRFLFIFSEYFKAVNAIKRNKIINELTQLVLTQEEPVSTYAIKCLQMATYIFKNYKLKIPLFKQLCDILIKRISIILELNTHDTLLPIERLEYATNLGENIYFDTLLKELINKDMDELGIKYSNAASYLDIGTNINCFTQMFHQMALLHYLIPHLEISDLLENPLFWNLIYSCLNVTICKIDEIIIIALTIIFDHIDNQEFMIKFLTTGGLSRICVIPYCLVSSMNVGWILEKISQNYSYMEFLLKNHIEDFELAIVYSIHFLSSSQESGTCNFIINLFGFQEFYKLFINQKGIKLIFESINKNDIFTQIKDSDYSIDEINQKYRHKKNRITNFLKILLSHIFIQISKITPLKIINSIPRIKYNTINYDINDILLDHFESIGGFKSNIVFFEELLEIDKFGVIVSILRMACEYDTKRSNLVIFKDAMYCLKFFSLYHKSKSLFIHPFDPHPKQLEQGNDLIMFFRALSDLNIQQEISYQLDFIPFKIYHNLLISCFSDFKTYNEVIRLGYEESLKGQESKEIKCDEESNLFMDRLIYSGFVYQILTCLPDMKLTLNDKIYAIKCLLILLTKKIVIQMLSVMQRKFIPKFGRSLITIANSQKFDDKTRSFMIFSLTLIYKISRYGYFQSIDHIIFRAYFLSEHVKVEKNKNCQYSFPNNQIITNQRRLEDSKIFNQFLAIQKIEKSKNQTLKPYFDLISQIYPTNQPDERPLRTSEKLITYNNILSSGNYKRGINISLSRIKLNSYVSVFSKFDKNLLYVEKSGEAPIYNAKQLIDDSIIVTYHNGISHLPYEKGSYIPSAQQIYFIDDSDNGEFIIGCGINNGLKSRFTNIWKYDPSKCRHKVIYKNSYHDLTNSKITHDNLNIFGIDINSNAHIIDIETSKRVAKFSNEKMASLPRMNCAVVNYNDNLLLFNGGLFCIRSHKFIHIFHEFDQHISGNFVHSDTKALINCELWDLRTLKLYNRMEKFQNFNVKKTYNDDILMGIKLQDYIKTTSSEDQAFYWGNFIAPYQNSLAIFDAKKFSEIHKFNKIKNYAGNIYFHTNIEFANISRDSTKIAVGLKNQWRDQEKNYFKILEIGNKEIKEIEIDGSTQ